MNGCGDRGLFDDACSAGCPDGRYLRFGTGGLSGLPPFPARRYALFSQTDGETNSGGYLEPVYVSGVRTAAERGEIILPPGTAFAFYAFSAHTVNTVRSVTVTPVKDGEDLFCGALKTSGSPSGAIGQRAGFCVTDGARTLAFRLDSEPNAHFDSVAFDLLLICGQTP